MKWVLFLLALAGVAQPLAAQRCEARLNAPRAYPTAGFFVSAVVDFDGDGHADLTSSGSNSDTVFVYFGDGTGLGEAVAIAERAYTGPVVADFTGDGLPDLALSVHGEHDVHAVLVRNLGHRRFALPEVLPMDEYRYPRLAGDFAENGVADIIASGVNPYILINDGKGKFRRSAPLFGEGYYSPYSQIVPADVTSDGDLDLVIADEGGSLQIYRGHGDATFTRKQTWFGAGNVVVADMDRDGFNDVVDVHQYGPINVFRGPTFDFDSPASSVTAPRPSAAVTGDVNGDGAPDLVVLNRAEDPWSYKPKYAPRLLVFLNDGRGGLHLKDEIVLGSTQYFFPFVLADFDGDHALDLVFASNEDFAAPSATVARGRGDGTFDVLHVTRGSASVAASVDLDSDGNDELLAYRTGSLAVGRTLPDGTFEFSETVPAFSSAYAFGDPNVRGVRTFYAASADDVQWYSRDSGGVWAQIGSLPIPDVRALSSVDLNGDGRREIAAVTRHPRTGSAEVRVLNPGTGRHLFFATLPDSVSFWIGTGDVNGDGRTDLLVSGGGTSRTVEYGREELQENGFLSLFLGRGTGAFSAELRVMEGMALATMPRTGDFDGDGKTDVIVATKDGVLLLASGRSSGSLPVSLLPSRGSKADAFQILAADVNGDGIDDILTGSNTLLEGSASGLINRGTYHLGPTSSARAIVRRSGATLPSLVATVSSAGEQIRADFVCGGPL